MSDADQLSIKEAVSEKEKTKVKISEELISEELSPEELISEELSPEELISEELSPEKVISEGKLLKQRTSKELQNDFWQLLNRIPGKDFKQYIQETETFNKQARINVYQNAYYWRLVNILKQDFPVLWELLGDNIFEQLALYYIKHYPSTHFSVRYFGEQLSECLIRTKPFKDKPNLAEMAEFEWSIGLGLDAANAEHFNISHMRSLPQTELPFLQFNLHPACFVVNHKWNTLAVYNAVKNKAKPIEFIKNASLAYVIIWRNHTQVKFKSLLAAETIILKSILAKENFAQILENLLETMQEEKIPSFAMNTLAIWGAEGILKSTRQL